MKLTKVGIDELQANNYNPNSMTPKEYRALIYSLNKFGQVIPILVQPKKNDKYVIIDGEHRHKAMVEQGFKEVFVVEAKNYKDQDKYKMLTVALDDIRGTVDKGIVEKIFEDLTDDVREFFDIVNVQLVEQENKYREFEKTGGIDWDEVDGWEETDTDVPYSLIGTEGEVDQIRKLDSLLNPLKIETIQFIIEHCSRRELDDDEKAFLLLQLAYRRALTTQYMPFRENPTKPLSVVLRTKVENAKRVFDFAKKLNDEKRAPKSGEEPVHGDE